jgi:hypothetical protein
LILGSSQQFVGNSLETNAQLSESGNNNEDVIRGSVRHQLFGPLLQRKSNFRAKKYPLLGIPIDANIDSNQNSQQISPKEKTRTRRSLYFTNYGYTVPYLYPYYNGYLNYGGYGGYDGYGYDPFCDYY